MTFSALSQVTLSSSEPGSSSTQAIQGGFSTSVFSLLMEIWFEGRKMISGQFASTTGIWRTHYPDLGDLGHKVARTASYI